MLRIFLARETINLRVECLLLQIVTHGYNLITVIMVLDQSLSVETAVLWEKEMFWVSDARCKELLEFCFSFSSVHFKLFTHR